MYAELVLIPSTFSRRRISDVRGTVTIPDAQQARHKLLSVGLPAVAGASLPATGGEVDLKQSRAMTRGN